MSRTVRLGLAATVVVGLVAGIVSAKEYKQLTVGTLPTGSVTFATMNALSNVMKDKLPWPMRVTPTSGGSVSLTLTEKGEYPLCISTAQEVNDAYRGVRGWRKSPNLRIIAITFPLTGSIIVKGDSGLTDVGQLKGKRVTGEYKAMLVGHELTEAALANHGLTWKDVRMIPTASIDTGLDALREGRADAIYGAIGPATFREADATIPGGIRYLSMEPGPEALKRMKRVAPGTYLVPAKKGSFPGIREDIYVQAFDYYLCANKNLDNEQAYQLVKAMVQNAEAIRTSIPPFRGFSKDKMVKADVTAPYHDGAIKAYKELGMWTPDADKAQHELLAESGKKG